MKWWAGTLSFTLAPRQGRYLLRALLQERYNERLGDVCGIWGVDPFFPIFLSEDVDHPPFLPSLYRVFRQPLPLRYLTLM